METIDRTTHPKLFAAMDAAAAQFWSYPPAEWQDNFIDAWIATHTKAKYFIAETQPNAVVTDGHWSPIVAKTLAAAKRSANRSRCFQGTAAHVAVQHADGHFMCVATRNPGGVWSEISEVLA